MEDIEIMKRAKQYIESLANGIDPLTGNEVADTDVVNNVRISRCLFYTAGVLQKVIDNGGEVQREKLKRSDRAEFSLTDEQALALKPEDSELSASRVASLINTQIDEMTMKKLKGTTITHFMLNAGLIDETTDSSGRPCRLPNDEGMKIGIVEREFDNAGKKIWYSAYSPEAQQFVFDNIDAIAALAAEEEAEKAAEKAERKRLAAEDAEGADDI